MKQFSKKIIPFRLLSTKTLSALCLGAFLSSCANMGTVNKDTQVDIEVKKYVLDNGLILLVAPNPKLPIVSYYTLFDVGGRDEKKGTTGATHFLEHMMFKGAKKYGPGIFDSSIEKNGGNTNAFTSNDMTVYYQNIPNGFLNKMIDMEADRMQNLLLEKKSFESERKVIFEERKMRYENSPGGLLFLEMMKKMYVGTPYGQSVIGDVADLKALTRAQMMDFFKKYYVPNNAVVAIAGDVDPQKVYEEVKKAYGPMPKSQELEALKKAVSGKEIFKSQTEFGKEYKVYSTSPNPIFLMAFESSPAGAPEMYSADVLSIILGNGGSSYLNQKFVRSEKPMLDDISLSNFNLLNAGVIYFSGEVKPGVQVADVKEGIESSFKEMCESAITARTLQKAKNQIMANSYEELKTNSGVALMLVKNEKWFGNYKYTLDDTRKYNAVSLSEVQNICKKTLQTSKSIFISTWNKYPKTTEGK